MKIREIGEFGLIERIGSLFESPEGVKGIGDDCAVIPQKSGMDTLVSTDMLVEDCHFLIGDISARDLGWKSAAVNFSDIAAMGGRPIGSFLSFALPSKLDRQWVMEFMEGYRDMSSEVGAPLLGGDTTSSKDKLCINVTVLGECPHGQAKLRCNARVGDLVCVSGCLGDSGAGLKVILDHLQRGREESILVERHYRPMPGIEEGLRLSSCPGVHAMMDISDGIASDLRHILKASSVGARISLEKLPLSDELRCCAKKYSWDIYALATSSGEDYHLLFTLDAAYADILGPNDTVIGELVEGEGIEWLGSQTDYMGFRHF